MPGIDNYSLDNYGLDGPPDTIQRATGTVTSTSTTYLFEQTEGNYDAPAVFVSGLSFRPNVIIVRTTVTFLRLTHYDRASNGNQQPTANGSFYNYAYTTGYSVSGRGQGFVRIYLFNTQAGAIASGKPGYISNSGFGLPVKDTNVLYEWEALYIPE